MAQYEPLPQTPLSLTQLCLVFVNKNLEKLPSFSFASLNKEVREKLWRFAVKDHYIHDQKLEAFLPPSTDTKELDLSGCDRISDLSIALIAKKYPTLQSLNLTWCTGLTLAAFKALPLGNPQIHTLNLSYTSIDDQGLTFISQGYPTLRAIGLQGCQEITDAGIAKLVHKCTDLLSVDLSHCKKLTSNSVKTIAQNLAKLTHFDVSYCGEGVVSEGSVQKIAKGLHRLQSVGLADSKISEGALQKLVQSCTSLVSLDVSFCLQLNITNPDKITKYITGFQRFLASGVPLTEAVLLKILEATPDLRELDVSHNDFIKEQWVTALITNPSLVKNLRVLNMSYPKIANSRGAQALAEARQGLQVYYYFPPS